MIGIMGITALLEPEMDNNLRLLLRVLLCGIGICVLAKFTDRSELYALFALIPIALYNGKRGYDNVFVKYGFYLFYPVHLALLALIFR